MIQPGNSTGRFRCCNQLLRHILTALLVGLWVCSASSQVSTPAASTPPYKNSSLPVEQRVKDLLGRMTLLEKATMLSGSSWMESASIDRLGIPAIKMADGPLGVRSWSGSSAINPSRAQALTTAFPAGTAMAATWDTDLVQREGQAIGQEVKALGRDMILGPTVNINRVPLWGRNFEGYGEDPYLTSRLGVAFIRGVQGEGVIASVKHFAANNEEFERHRIDAQVSQRALNEIYLPAFKAAVKEASVWNVMSAYNKLNGIHCAESTPLLHDILKQNWGFEGFVISDWGSTYSTAATVNAGMDLEMPAGAPLANWMSLPTTQVAGNSGGWLTANKVMAEIAAGHITPAVVEENAGRILRVIFASGLFDHPHTETGEVDTPAQRAVALQAATESIVLLKNAGTLLPLDPKHVHSLAVIGPNAAIARTGGGGSSLVVPKYAISPLEGIRQRTGSTIKVSYALGVSMEGENPEQDNPGARARLIREATDVAAHADAAVVVVGRYSKLETEDFDIRTMDLPAGQDELIQAVVHANPRTVVVINTGAAVTMTKWLTQTPAVLDMWYGGQEGGHALASILFGDAAPSGKLPLSFPKAWQDSPAYGHYPGENLRVDYAEGIYVGYRYFDTKNVEPLFPFGFGLSYTNFEYSGLVVSPAKISGDQSIQVSLKVRNSGTRKGAEVIQLYVHDGHSKIDRPVRELKGFRRIELTRGETQSVQFKLDNSAFSYYNAEKSAWVAEPGEFLISVGSSSRDLRLQAPLRLDPQQ